ncbi:VRR_NUC domain-containing protein/HIRAN domain-containing protein [Cephalotus follicularis]|uniref:Fanconi-associated nuclease n=1 Tax=Cephalotus follicularis TaxID=3775 RepID=A0A1Q3BE49_CEPFO|nr:VRR_NUC domain-containing protein/HIRAN domain-containing protein [Cephalotus follicularis]
MLVGRESLIRLVGKRRRHLGNGHHLLSSPFPITDHNTTSTPDWATCPVCGTQISSQDNVIINSHLDECLSQSLSNHGGSKRKLTQRTLLQFNFSSSTTSSNSGFTNKEDCLSLNQSIDDQTSCQVGVPQSHAVDDCDIFGVILQTFIVGRRFVDGKEFNLGVGSTISLLPDPHNVKDPNAIKVLYAESGSLKVLGFLSRELAQSLSPLIVKYGLNFEGCVTSIPKHSLDVVPIQIVCHEKLLLNGENVYDDIEDCRRLWKNALNVVESAKGYPSGTAKYQQNFCLLIQEVLKSNPHLFTDEEKSFMESFTSLSEDSQRLFVRLYMRKAPLSFGGCYAGPWFRMSNISYREVSDSQQAIKGLSAKGYICSFGDTNRIHNDDLKEILNLLTVTELREISCMFKKASYCNRGSRKQDLVSSLHFSYGDGLCPLLPIVILNKFGTCVKISSTAESLMWRVERLFFLNGEQDLSAFLLVDLGIVKYPTYKCIISEQIFSSRQDLLAFEEAIKLAQIMDRSLEENDMEVLLRCTMIAESHILSSSAETVEYTTESVPTYRSSFSELWVYSKVVLLGVSFLEREHRYNEAVNLLKRLLNCFTSDRRRGYWTLRLSIDLEHIGCVNESLSIAEEGLLDPWVRAGSRVALQRRVLRLSKPPRRWKTPSFSESINRKITEVCIPGRPLNCEIGMKNRFYGEDGEQYGVEQLALQYYAGEGGGWLGVHTESGIWLTIFGLLMWDILFSDIPNVFRTRFQTAPLDLETDSFYRVRKSLIESHLQKINDGMAEEILIISWDAHVGTACRGISWDRHTLSELRAAVTCIGGPCLASLCRHLAQDYRSWSSGMPDLLLWRFHGDYGGEAKLVEVKGPRDRLSEQQRAWLLILMDCGFNTEVCKVSPAPISD